MDALEEAVEKLTPPILLGEVGADEEDYNQMVAILAASKEFDFASFPRLFAYVASEYMYWEGDKESRFWEGLQGRLGRSVKDYSQQDLYAYLCKGLDALKAVPGPDAGTHRHVARCAMQSYLQRSRVGALSELVDRLRFRRFGSDTALLDALLNHWIFQLRLTSLRHLLPVEPTRVAGFFRALVAGEGYPLAYFRNDSLFTSEYESGGAVWGKRKSVDQPDIEIRRDQSGRLLVFVPQGFQIPVTTSNLAGKYETAPQGGCFRVVRSNLESEKAFSFRLTRHGPDQMRILTSPNTIVDLPTLSVLPAFLTDLDGYLVAPGRRFPTTGGTLYCAPGAEVGGFEEASTPPVLSGFESYRAVTGRAIGPIVKATLGHTEVKWQGSEFVKQVEIQGTEEIGPRIHIARKGNVSIIVPENIGSELRLLIRQVGENGIEHTVYEGSATVSGGLVILGPPMLKQVGSYRIYASRTDGRRLLSRLIHFAPGLYIQKGLPVRMDVFAYLFVAGDGLVFAATQGSEPDKAVSDKGFRVAVPPYVSEAMVRLNYGTKGMVAIPVKVPRFDGRIFIGDAEFPLATLFPIESLEHPDLVLRISGPSGSTIRLEIRRKQDDILMEVVETQIPPSGELEEFSRILFKQVFHRLLDCPDETQLWVRLDGHKLPEPIMQLTAALPHAGSIEIVHSNNEAYINLSDCSLVPLGCLSLRIGPLQEEPLELAGPPQGKCFKIDLPIRKIPYDKGPVNLALIARCMRAERIMQEWVFEPR